MIIEPKEENAFGDLSRLAKQTLIDMLFVLKLMDEGHLCIACDVFGEGRFELRELTNTGGSLQEVSKDVVRNLFDCEFISWANDQPGNVLLRTKS